MYGLRKIPRRDGIQDVLLGTPPFLTGGAFFYGKIKGGKTTAMQSFAQKYHDNPQRNYKIWDFYGGQRNEQYYWAFPSSHIKYWNFVKKKVRLDADGPKQYRVQFWFPFTTELPEKLPYLEGHVFSKPFRIPLSDLKIDDFKLVIGNVSDEGQTFWSDFVDGLKKTDDLIEFTQRAEKLKGMSSSLWKNCIAPLIKMRFVCSDVDPLRIDIHEQAKDREAITILCVDQIDARFRLLVLGYLMRKMAELLDNGKISTKNIIMMREATQFFRATAQSVVEENYKIFRVYLSEWIRYGRRGMHLFLDAQSPSETAGMVDGSQDMTLLAKMPSEEDRKIVTDILRRDNLMTPSQVSDLGQLEPGEYYVIFSGKKARKWYLFLPRSMFWQEGFGNFFEYWKRRRNTWFDITAQKQTIEDTLQARQKEIDERKKIDDHMKKELQRVQKQEEETARLNELQRAEELKQLAKRKARESIEEQTGEKIRGRKPMQTVKKEQEVQEDDFSDIFG